MPGNHSILVLKKHGGNNIKRISLFSKGLEGCHFNGDYPFIRVKKELIKVKENKMKMKDSRLVFKTLLVVLAIWILTFNVFGLIMGNYSESTISMDCESKTSVGTRVVNGGGYFLNAYAEILLFLNKIEGSENQGIDYIELQEILGRAHDSMSQAKSAYDSLVELAAVIPFDPKAIQQLKIFDYEGFQEKNELNRIVFKEVAAYLSHGDVRGFYSRLLAGTGDILKRLDDIKLSIDARKFPELKDLWGLNQACSGTLLFGQYAAEVFITLK